MTEIDLSRADWHKSSYSSQDGNCVEVATNMAGRVYVRDSRDPQGTVLRFTSEEWQAFITSIKATR